MSRLTRFPRILAERLNFFAKSRGSENNGECPGTSGRQSSGSGERLRKWAFELSGYNKFGLYTDDVLNHTIPSVAKALERLPGDVVDDRNYRLIRAIQLDFLKIHLPRDQWITYEDDRDYRYLTPYVAEVEAEWREIYEFGCTNYRHE